MRKKKDLYYLTLCMYFIQGTVPWKWAEHDTVGQGTISRRAIEVFFSIRITLKADNSWNNNRF